MSECLTYKDIDGLPDELLAQLNISESDRKDMLLVDLIEKHQPISLNHLLIKIWKKTGKIETKTKLMARLYRLSVNKKMIRSVDGRKGVYEVKS